MRSKQLKLEKQKIAWNTKANGGSILVRLSTNLSIHGHGSSSRSSWSILGSRSFSSIVHCWPNSFYCPLSIASYFHISITVFKPTCFLYVIQNDNYRNKIKTKMDSRELQSIAQKKTIKIIISVRSETILQLHLLN